MLLPPLADDVSVFVNHPHATAVHRNDSSVRLDVDVDADDDADDEVARVGRSVGCGSLVVPVAVGMVPEEAICGFGTGAGDVARRSRTRCAYLCAFSTSFLRS